MTEFFTRKEISTDIKDLIAKFNGRLEGQDDKRSCTFEMCCESSLQIKKNLTNHVR